MLIAVFIETQGIRSADELKKKTKILVCERGKVKSHHRFLATDPTMSCARGADGTGQFEMLNRYGILK